MIGLRGFQIEELNPSYKGDNVGYSGLHAWARKKIPETNICKNCKIEGKTDITNKSGNYLRNINDWERLCRKCHMDSDGRNEQLRQIGKSRKLTDKVCPECKTVFHTDKRSQINCSHKCGHKAMWRKRKEKIK